MQQPTDQLGTESDPVFTEAQLALNEIIPDRPEIVVEATDDLLGLANDVELNWRRLGTYELALRQPLQETLDAAAHAEQPEETAASELFRELSGEDRHALVALGEIFVNADLEGFRSEIASPAILSDESRHIADNPVYKRFATSLEAARRVSLDLLPSAHEIGNHHRSDTNQRLQLLRQLENLQDGDGESGKVSWGDMVAWQQTAEELRLMCATHEEQSLLAAASFLRLIERIEEPRVHGVLKRLTIAEVRNDPRASEQMVSTEPWRLAVDVLYQATLAEVAHAEDDSPDGVQFHQGYLDRISAISGAATQRRKLMPRIRRSGQEEDQPQIEDMITITRLAGAGTQRLLEVGFYDDMAKWAAVLLPRFDETYYGVAHEFAESVDDLFGYMKEKVNTATDEVAQQQAMLATLEVEAWVESLFDTLPPIELMSPGEVRRIAETAREYSDRPHAMAGRPFHRAIEQAVEEQQLAERRERSIEMVKRVSELFSSYQATGKAQRRADPELAVSQKIDRDEEFRANRFVNHVVPKMLTAVAGRFDKNGADAVQVVEQLFADAAEERSLRNQLREFGRVPDMPDVSLADMTEWLDFNYSRFLDGQKFSGSVAFTSVAEAIEAYYAAQEEATAEEPEEAPEPPVEPGPEASEEPTPEPDGDADEPLREMPPELIGIADQLDFVVLPPETGVKTIEVAFEREFGKGTARQADWKKIQKLIEQRDAFAQMEGVEARVGIGRKGTLGTRYPYFVLEIETDTRLVAVAENPIEDNASYVYASDVPTEENIADVIPWQEVFALRKSSAREWGAKQRVHAAGIGLDAHWKKLATEVSQEITRR